MAAFFARRPGMVNAAVFPRSSRTGGEAAPVKLSGSALIRHGFAVPIFCIGRPVVPRGLFAWAPSHVVPPCP